MACAVPHVLSSADIVGSSETIAKTEHYARVRQTYRCSVGGEEIRVDSIECRYCGGHIGGGMSGFVDVTWGMVKKMRRHCMGTN